MQGKTEGKRRRGWQRMRCLDSFTNSMGMMSPFGRLMNLSKLREIGKDRGAWSAAVHGVAESDRTSTKQQHMLRYILFPEIFILICMWYTLDRASLVA